MEARCAVVVSGVGLLQARAAGRRRQRRASAHGGGAVDGCVGVAALRGVGLGGAGSVGGAAAVAALEGAACSFVVGEGGWKEGRGGGTSTGGRRRRKVREGGLVIRADAALPQPPAPRTPLPNAPWAPARSRAQARRRASERGIMVAVGGRRSRGGGGGRAADRRAGLWRTVMRLECRGPQNGGGAHSHWV